MNLSEMSPKEVDTILAGIYEKCNKLHYDIDNLTSYIEREEKDEAKSPSEWRRKHIKEEQAKLAKKREELLALHTEARPYNEEYSKRRWSRFYLVVNANGHVHKDKCCNTCFPRTRYSWLYEMSGMTEEEAVAEYGEKMCTECYPSAPTIAKMMGPSKFKQMEDAKKAEREAKKTEKAAKLAEKSITNPDGTPLRDDHGYQIKTTATAKYVMNRCIEAVMRYEKRPEQHTNPDYKEKWHNNYAETAERMAVALAAKLNLSKEELIKKARKKAERELRHY